MIHENDQAGSVAFTEGAGVAPQAASKASDHKSRLHEVIERHLPDQHVGEITAIELRALLRDFINAMPLK